MNVLLDYLFIILLMVFFPAGKPWLRNYECSFDMWSLFDPMFGVISYVAGPCQVDHGAGAYTDDVGCTT